MTPENLSIRYFLKELLLAERTEVFSLDVNAAYLHLINVELLHYPHSPVDYLISRPQHGVWGRRRNSMNSITFFKST